MHGSALGLAVFLALQPVPPAGAAEESGFHEQQVEEFLLRNVNGNGGDGVWTWASMVRSCTKTLMYGSPEQDPEQFRVRLTPDARQFLRQCAVVKGFTLRTTPYVEPVRVEPMTYTLGRRIEILGKVMSEWMTDTSKTGVTVEARNEECARWIAGLPEWKSMIARTGGLNESGTGISANVKVLLAACAEGKGFAIRDEKKGVPLDALNEAARLESEASKTGQ